MEVKEKSQKRELIKSVAIVFLVILLILTFFSNTIMNYSLPEVAAKPISSGTINAKIRGSGTVEANESYEVMIAETREVRSISVRVGDFVAEGDVLFVLADMESQELKAAQEQLDALNLQYQQQLLTLSLEKAGEDQAMKVLREELKDAQRQRDENLVTADELSAAKSALATAEADLQQVVLTLEELNAALNDDEDYQLAKTAVDTWKSKAETLDAEIQDLKNQINELTNGGVSDINTQIAEAWSEVAVAQEKLNVTLTVYGEELTELFGKVAEQSTVIAEEINKIFGVNGGFSLSLLQRAYIEEYLANNPTEDREAYDILITVYVSLEEKTKAYTKLINEQNQDSQSSGAQLSTLQSKLTTAQNEYYTASQQLQEAERTLASAETARTALKSRIKNFEASQRDQSAYVDELKAELSALESKKSLYDQACELVKQRQRAIEDALVGKDINQQLDDLSLQTLRDQIEKAQEQVDKYTAQSVDAEICANVSGRITAIHVTAGKEAAAGTSMATIEMVDRGYMLKIPVTVEQSRQVRVGDTANVTNYYWGAELEAVLESIIADPQNPGRGKLLVFRINGDVDAGSNLTLSIGQRSANYDAIIPKSALRQDTNGYFVLVITVKSSPLSNRYIATRVDVQVLAEDDTSAAVTGLSGGDFIITTSNKPVEAGQQVRMVENP